MTSHATEYEPALLTPQELLLSQLPGLLSLWKHDRGTDDHRTAKDLVAVWSGLQRLVLCRGLIEPLRNADEVIHDDMDIFLRAIISHDFDFERWMCEMQNLDTDWDQCCAEAEELEWRTRAGFDELDRTELFTWFAATKAPSDARIQAWLESLSGRCDAAEQFIADRPDLFLCLATDLAAVIASSRPDLEDSDPLLWETLGKHRRIEEARDEVELTPSRHAVLASVRHGAQALSPEIMAAEHPKVVLATGKAVTKPMLNGPDRRPSVEPEFKVGDLVSPRSNPGLLLPVLEVVPGGVEQRYRVFENNAKVTYYESQLQLALAPSDEPKCE